MGMSMPLVQSDFIAASGSNNGIRILPLARARFIFGIFGSRLLLSTDFPDLRLCAPVEDGLNFASKVPVSSDNLAAENMEPTFESLPHSLSSSE